MLKDNDMLRGFNHSRPAAARTLGGAGGQDKNAGDDDELVLVPFQGLIALIIPYLS
jgi:hypothetical protein